MQAPPVIRVDGMSKLYRVGTNAHQHGRLTEALWEGLSKPFRRGRERPYDDRTEDDFWALRGLRNAERAG